METFLAILMVLGMYIVAPAVLGLAIAGAVVLWSRRAEKARPRESVEEAITAMEDLIAEVRSDEMTKPAARQTSPQPSKKT